MSHSVGSGLIHSGFDPVTLAFAESHHYLKVRFNLEEIPLFKPRYNIAPTQQAPVIANLDGANRVELFQWGLVPSWAKDVSIGNRMINARAETLAEKSSFKRLLNNRRCLVLADGFYEWRKEGKGKVPMLFKLPGFAMIRERGTWRVSQDKRGPLWVERSVPSRNNRAPFFTTGCRPRRLE